MPQPFAKPSYTALTKKLKKAAQITAEKSMSAAANDAKEKEGVSVDGTWYPVKEYPMSLEDFNYFVMNVFLLYIALYTIVDLKLTGMWGGGSSSVV